MPVFIYLQRLLNMGNFLTDLFSRVGTNTSVIILFFFHCRISHCKAKQKSINKYTKNRSVAADFTLSLVSLKLSNMHVFQMWTVKRPHACNEQTTKRSERKRKSYPKSFLMRHPGEDVPKVILFIWTFSVMLLEPFPNYLRALLVTFDQWP